MARLTGKAEAAGDSDQYQNGVDQVNRVRSTPTDGEQQRRAESIADIAPHEQLAAVEEIGGVSGEQKQDKAGRELGEADVSEVEGAIGSGIDLPAHGHRLHLQRHDDEEARKSVADEVGMSEGDASG